MIATQASDVVAERFKPVWWLPRPTLHQGTRIMVTIVLDALAAGLDTAEILRHYPTLTSDGVRAAAAYGAWLAKQEIHTLTSTP